MLTQFRVWQPARFEFHVRFGSLADITVPPRLCPLCPRKQTSLKRRYRRRLGRRQKHRLVVNLTAAVTLMSPFDLRHLHVLEAKDNV
jgi:anti-sigma factor RsiW